MKKYCVLVIAISFLAGSSFAQVGINSDNSAPDPSAMLDVKSINQGFLPPRMTFEQRSAIQNPVDGLMVYCTNCRPDGSGVLSLFQNGKWRDQNFSCNVPLTPDPGVHIAVVNQITWNWGQVPIAKGYKWNTLNDVNNALDVGLVNTYTESGLTCWNDYTRYIWAYNDCGNSDVLLVMQATPMVTFPSLPSPGIHVPSNNQIIWNWNIVAEALGYKWGTTNDYFSATDMGNDTTKTESELTCGNNYTRYLWAYDACGYSLAVELASSTIACYPCNDTLAISHQVTNGVAPIDKTVSYSMVTGIPGEDGKCWITRNLGASQQATAVNDVTEASAGWYWQFNRKNGYYHDGTTLTPSWTITSINENSDWLIANDPCNLELGATWRLPTYTEWYNVDINCGWNNWNGPWGSGLKLHAAGYLNYSNGSLTGRGSEGYYWSSKQISTNYGWDLGFASSFCTMYDDGKAYGVSVRCLRDN